MLATSTVNVTVPPGFGHEPADGVLETEIEGSTSLKATVASSVPSAMFPSPSSARAVTVF